MISIDAIKSITDEMLLSRGLTAVAFGEDHCAEVAINGITVTLMYDTEPLELVWLFADLGLAPEEPEALRGILRYSQVLWAAGQMTVALDRDGEHLVGYKSLAATSLTPDVLGNQLDGLLAGAVDLLDRLAYLDFDLHLPEPELTQDPSFVDWRA